MFGKERLMKMMNKVPLRSVVAVALLLLLAGAVVLGASAWLRPHPQAETVSVELGSSKFTPGSATRGPGLFLLEVTNRSGRQAFTLQLRRDNGGDIVHEWGVQAGEGQTWSETVDLPQGGYNLSLAENPACLFHITVQ